MISLRALPRAGDCPRCRRNCLRRRALVRPRHEDFVYRRGTCMLRLINLLKPLAISVMLLGILAATQADARADQITFRTLGCFAAVGAGCTFSTSSTASSTSSPYLIFISQGRRRSTPTPRAASRSQISPRSSQLRPALRNLFPLDVSLSRSYRPLRSPAATGP